MSIQRELDMRHLSALCALSIIAILISCSKGEFETQIKDVETMSFVASVEQFGDSGGTKTTLSSQNTILWSEGDELAIFQGATIADKFMVKSETAASTNGVFSKVSVSENNGDYISGTEVPANIAVYPFDADLIISGINKEDGAPDSYTISNLTVQPEQTYAENSFGNGSFPMIAVTSSVEDYVLKFRNLLGAIKLQLLGNCKVKIIEIKGNRDEIIAGEAEVTVCSGEDSVPVLTMMENGSTTISLNCGDGVQLNTTTLTEFVIAVPPTVFEGGFTVTVTDEDGTDMPIVAAVSNSVSRSSILKMPSMAIPVSTVPDGNIEFEDELVEEICIREFDANNDGNLSYAEAAAVTDIGAVFKGTTIRKFNEFEYFTSVLSLKDFAFKECVSLISIILPDGITSIGDYAFTDCSSLSSIILPDRLSSISQGMFSDCISLSSLTLPEGITSIGRQAFYGCSSLNSLTLPQGVTSIGQYAFVNCTLLSSIVLPDDITMIKGYAFCNCSSLTTVSFPDDLVSIGEYAFFNCTSLKSITLPEGMTVINESAFFNCSALETCTFNSSSLQVYGIRAFDNCQSLTAIYVPEESVDEYEAGWSSYSHLFKSQFIEFRDQKVKTLCINAFDTNNDGKLSYGEAAAVTDLGTVFSESQIVSFDECQYFTSLSSIGNWAFNGCISLRNITLPKNITSIGDGAFFGCISMNSITLPNGITSIGNYAFQVCESLTSITMPSVLTSIGEYAFTNCFYLQTCTIESPELTVYGVNAFSGCNRLQAIYVPAASVAKYKEGWSVFEVKIKPIPVSQ